MEFLTLICPNLKCRKTLQVPESVRGKIVKCGYCMTTFTVPVRPDPEPVARGAGEARDGSKSADR